MFRAIKDLFRREEQKPEALRIPFSEIPGFIERQIQAIRDERDRNTREPREKITASISHIREFVDSLTTLEAESEVHPKIKSIAKNALPQFTKSMHQVLAKEPSGDAEQFYVTAAEMLKGCIKSLKGQGKYLAAVFPEEMREFRASVKDFGAAINTLTAEITRSREKLLQAEKVRSIYDEITRVREKYSAGLERIEDLESAIKACEGRIEEIRGSILRLEEDPAYASFRALENAVQLLKREKEQIEREVASTRNTALQVFRKAERVLERNKNHAAAVKAQRMQDLIADIPGEHDAEIFPLLTEAMPSVTELIVKGDLVLKNKEEIHLFSDPKLLAGELEEIVQRYRDHAARLDERRQALASSPLPETKRLRERDLAACSVSLQQAVQARNEALQQVPQMSRRSAELTAELQQQIAELAGQEVTVLTDDLPPPPNAGVE